ncbi:MAG: nucleoside 2-deoxyribosyltransferase [Acidobacteriia bacterium]|nr:nucleoside 2-deoxyribosyltransferase [Terriglobia bacterium]
MEPVTSSRKTKRRKRRKRAGARTAGEGGKRTAPLAFPKHAVSKCLRIPRAILEQNAGKECPDREAAKFAGIGYTGDIGVEISSAIKYGLLERPVPGTVKPTDITRRIVRPQKPNDVTDAMREAVLRAPLISDAYKHYRGENLPDLTFLANAARDTFKVPAEKVDEFVSVFVETLEDAKLLEEVGGKRRVLDVTRTPDVQGSGTTAEEHLKKVSKGVSVQPTDTCFVMMPFAGPLGGYYTSIYEPAIKRAGLGPIRADTDIFGTGKIIDQIWSGINKARVLVAELTGRNPNVLYELGLAHALRKPVVLVSSNEPDVPFDVRHVRVIYYDVTDPFWGDKLIDKVAENIISALKNPKEAILFGD